MHHMKKMHIFSLLIFLISQESLGLTKQQEETNTAIRDICQMLASFASSSAVAKQNGALLSEVIEIFKSGTPNQSLDSQVEAALMVPYQFNYTPDESYLFVHKACIENSSFFKD